MNSGRRLAVLHIQLTAPGRLGAYLDAREAAWCRFELQGNVLVLTEAFLEDPGDVALLDGLARTAFYGSGGVYGAFSPGIWAQYGTRLVKYGLSEGNMLLEQLNKPCEKR